MRVLQFGKFYPPHIGGIEKVMFDITEGLNRRGIRCDVLCSNKERKYVEESLNGYQVVRTKSYGVFFSASITPQIVRKLKEMQGDYEIIHVHLPDPMANVALFLARPASKVILHWHNDVVRQKLLLTLYLPLQTWMLKRADAVITTSPNYIDGSPYLAGHKPKCHVVPIGVDRARMKVEPDTVAGIRERFRGKRIVFSMGRLSHYKGYRYLIDAAKHLSDEYVILIAGSGPLHGALSSRIAGEGLTEKVFLLGPVQYDDVGSYYEACDVYCLSSISRNEGFGIVQLEAMLFKKPVVSTRIPGSGVSWANLDGETGLVVEPKDPRALARALAAICSDRELYRKLGSNGFRRASEYFTMDRMLTSTIEVYEKVLRESAR
jgi:glycosyltransferase involved in cell wall biosynthesis